MASDGFFSTVHVNDAAASPTSSVHVLMVRYMGSSVASSPMFSTNSGLRPASWSEARMCAANAALEMPLGRTSMYLGREAE